MSEGQPRLVLHVLARVIDLDSGSWGSLAERHLLIESPAHDGRRIDMEHRYIDTEMASNVECELDLGVELGSNEHLQKARFALLTSLAPRVGDAVHLKGLKQLNLKNSNFAGDKVAVTRLCTEK